MYANCMQLEERQLKENTQESKILGKSTKGELENDK